MDTALSAVPSILSARSGFRFTAQAIPLEKLVAFGNATDGIELEGGSIDVRQVSCVGSSAFGIDATAAYMGTVSDSFLWNNGLSAVDGLGAGRVLYSDGVTALAGADGNIDTDPQFVNEAIGDLHLAAGSPCINSDDPTSTLDPESTRADMGALFFNFCAPAIICTQPQTFPPCDPTLTWDGFASLSSPQPFALTLNDAPTLSFAIFFYGIGSPTLINGAFGDICVGGPFQRSPPVAWGRNPAEGPCAGTFEFDFNAYAQTGGDPAIIAGSNVIGHLWYRYGAAPGNARFSDGIQIPICP